MKRKSSISTIIFTASLFISMVFCFSPQVSYANAPADVTLQYDAGTQNLAVKIDHSSVFTGLHHIKTVEIKKNSSIISTTNYDTQPSESPFTYTYKVTTAEGDKLEVTATCSLSGSKTATITVTRPQK